MPPRLPHVALALLAIALMTGAARAEAAPADGVRVAQKPAATASQGAKKVRYANLVLSGAVPEGPGGGGPFADMKSDLAKIVARFDRAAADDSIEGMVLDIQNPGLGRGGVNELRAAIKRFRDKGKTVHAQLEMAMASDYLIACACDQIIMPESGLLVLPGVRAEGLFMKGLLAKVGVEADILHMGDAKGAGETYTRDAWSEPVKQNLTAMVDDLYQQLYETIGLDRPLTETQVREAVDKGVVGAGEALRLGLIDRLAYPDELRASLASKHEGAKLVYVENYGAKKVDTDFSGPAGFFKLMGVLAGAGSEGSAGGKKIAVVYAVGPIMTGESESELFSAATVGSTSLVKALDEADRDKDVVAIVLRVNSPGGSAIASDLIWRKTQQIKKPLIASMGDVAASGGYYISMGADKIFAEPQSITGSIGVVSGKMALAGLYKKLGLSVDVISRGENSGIFSSTNKFSEKERAAMLRMMEDIYGQFTGKAAKGRDMEHDKLLALASGKVYTGRQAKENGLVDELGSLHDAIAAAKKQAGLKEDEKVRIMTLPEQPDLFQELFGSGKQQREVTVRIESLALPPELRRAVGRLDVWRRLLERERVGLFMPVEVVVE